MLPPYCAHRQHKQCACTFAAPTHVRDSSVMNSTTDTHTSTCTNAYTHASKRIKIQTYMQAHKQTHTKLTYIQGVPKIPQYLVTKFQTHPDKTINNEISWILSSQQHPKKYLGSRKQTFQAYLNFVLGGSVKIMLVTFLGHPVYLNNYKHTHMQQANTHWHESKHKNEQAYMHKSTHI